MTDATIHLPGRLAAGLPGPIADRTRHRRSGRSEYTAYFTLILGAALPVAAAQWAADAARGRPGRGPVARALSHARTITPVIFMG